MRTQRPSFSETPDDPYVLETVTSARSMGWRRRARTVAAGSGLVRRAFPWIAIPVGLSFVTYTQTGYQYRIWPQLFLE
jgi:hypothetical protein